MNATTDSIRAACTVQTTFSSPLGDVLLARTAHGLAGVWFEGQKSHPGPLAAPLDADDALLHRTAGLLAAYLAGEAVAFDLPLDLHGTAFQRNVWRALLAIGRGRTASYGEIARSLGNPSAVRAVGGAIGRNPVSMIVPCHRVVGTDGTLTGYAGGMARKRSLLALEQPTRVA